MVFINDDDTTGSVGVVWPRAFPDVDLARLAAEVPWKRLGGEAPRSTVAAAIVGDSLDMSSTCAGERRRLTATATWATCPYLFEIKQRVEALTGSRTNFAVCTQEHYDDADGGQQQQIAYHADSTADLVPGSVIISVSLGATCCMLFKATAPLRPARKVEFAAGTVLAMTLPLQAHYMYATEPRLGVTLTFKLVKQFIDRRH